MKHDVLEQQRKYEPEHGQSGPKGEQQPVVSCDGVAIFFNGFNRRRALRGAPAAEFLISYGPDDDASYIWMSARDIRRNMWQFPEHKDELQKGLTEYN